MSIIILSSMLYCIYLHFANTRDMSDQAGDAQEPTSAVITSKYFIIELYLPDVTVL